MLNSAVRYHLTLKSSNEKTGPIPVSTSGAQTCPTACPFQKNGCYADGGPLAMHWAKVTAGARGDGFATFCARIAALPAGQLWRMNQAGDLPGAGDAIAPAAMRKLVAANRGRRGFTYTHKPMRTLQNRRAVQHANAEGFTVNLSANNLQHADELSALGIAPVVVVLPAEASANTVTPSGRKVVVCPATQRDDVTCATCKLCANNSATRPIVGFPAHGSSARRASVASIKWHGVKVPKARKALKSADGARRHASLSDIRERRQAS